MKTAMFLKTTFYALSDGSCNSSLPLVNFIVLMFVTEGCATTGKIAGGLRKHFNTALYLKIKLSIECLYSRYRF